MSISTLLGLMVATYTAWAAWRGQVYERRGLWGRTVSRDQQPGYFWALIALYGLLALVFLAVP